MESITIRIKHSTSFSSMMSLAFLDLEPNKALLYVDDNIVKGLFNDIIWIIYVVFSVF